MGAPSQSQIHTWTDQVAAFALKDLAGFESEYGTKAATSLWDMVDASGDPDVESALMAGALALDRMSLPATHLANLQSIFGRTAYRDFGAALSRLVTGTSGGGYSSFAAYLADKSAVVHPVFAELMRIVLGEGAFSINSDITTVFAPNYQTRTADRVYAGADGALSDLTSAAASATTADLTLFASNSHALYLGSRYKFTQAVIALSTKANVTINPLIEYWNGNAWTAVTSLSDDSAGLTKNLRTKWALPSDWEPSYKDKGGSTLAALERLYYIRIQRQAVTVGTPPVGTCIRLVPVAILGPNPSTHLGLDQPPLALVLITAASTVTVDPIVAVDFSRFREPGLRLRALTPIAASLTPTVAYTNQSGVDVTQAQGAWSSPAALDTVAVTLNGTDTGAQDVNTTGFAVSTTATDGCFEVYAAEARTPAI